VRLQNVAETYRNRVVPEAKGGGQRSCRTRTRIASARSRRPGQASRFTQVLEGIQARAGRHAPTAVLETMERVYSTVDRRSSTAASAAVWLPYLSVDRGRPAPAVAAR